MTCLSNLFGERTTTDYLPCWIQFVTNSFCSFSVCRFINHKHWETTVHFFNSSFFPDIKEIISRESLKVSGVNTIQLLHYGKTSWLQAFSKKGNLSKLHQFQTNAYGSGDLKSMLWCWILGIYFRWVFYNTPLRKAHAMPCILFVKKDQSLHTSNSEAAEGPSSVLVTCNLQALHIPKNPSSFMQVMIKKHAFYSHCPGFRRWGLKANLTELEATWVVIEKTFYQSVPCLPTCRNGHIFNSSPCPTFLDWVLWHETASSYWHVG